MSTENEPEVGQWWMCESKHTGRKSPMIKTKNGWGSIINNNGKVDPSFINKSPIFNPLYQMTAA